MNRTVRRHERIMDYTKNYCNIKSKMIYYKWVMKDAKIQTNQNKIE
jgi:hypothetical protein